MGESEQLSEELVARVDSTTETVWLDEITGVLENWLAGRTTWADLDQSAAEQLVKAAADLAWETWSKGNGVHAVLEESAPSYLEQILTRESNQIVALFYGLLFLNSARYVFDHQRVNEYRKMLMRKTRDLDVPILEAFKWFAAFGKLRTDPDVYAASWSKIQSNNELPKVQDIRHFVDENAHSTKTLHLVAHALWLIPLPLAYTSLDNDEGADLVEYANLLEVITDKLIKKNENDKVAHFRRAFAFRIKGRTHDAIEEMDRVLRLADPGDPMDFQLYQIYRLFTQEELTLRIVAESTERSAVAAAKSELEDRAQEIMSLMDAGQQQARQLIDGSLVRSVEVLGIFLALVAVLVTFVGSAVAPGDLIFWQRLALAVGGGVVSVLWFYALRAVVTSPSRKNSD